MTLPGLLRRVAVYGQLPTVPRPFLTYVDEGPDFRFIAVGIGAPWRDPIITLEINLGASKP
jgi:hypothetical protein